jgi:hypothetical protein
MNLEFSFLVFVVSFMSILYGRWYEARVCKRRADFLVKHYQEIANALILDRDTYKDLADTAIAKLKEFEDKL